MPNRPHALLGQLQATGGAIPTAYPAAYDCDGWARRFCEKLDDDFAFYYSFKYVFRLQRQAIRFLHNAELYSGQQQIGTDSHYFTLCLVDGEAWVFDNINRTGVSFNIFRDSLCLNYTVTAHDADVRKLMGAALWANTIVGFQQNRFVGQDWRESNPPIPYHAP